MDVRCEKCQTEYELDESRLKPTGVTVKCTHCGHMFKIRKKGSTNLGNPVPNPMSVVAPLPRSPASAGSLHDGARSPASAAEGARTKPSTLPPPSPGSAARSGRESGQPASEPRTWLLRLENGESRSCKELATLQQWILSGIVTRESLISRNGKTWKRLGDIAELGSYFAISDDAKASRGGRGGGAATLIGVGGNSGVGIQTTEVDLANIGGNGGKLPLPAERDEDFDNIEEDMISTAERPSPAFAGNVTAPANKANSGSLGTAPTLQLPPVPAAATRETTARNTAPPVPTRTTQPSGSPPAASRRPPTLPPPAPGAVAAMTDMAAQASAAPEKTIDKTAESSGAFSGTPKAQATGGFSGRVASISNEPAFTNGPSSGRVQRSSSGSSGPNSASASFAGKIRTEPGSDDVFRNTPSAVDDDETGPVHAPRSSSAGKWIAITALLAIGGAAAAIYFLVLRPSSDPKPNNGSDSAVLLGSANGSDSGSGSGSSAVATVTPDAATTPTQLAETVSAVNADIIGDLTDRLRSRAEALSKLDGALASEPSILAMRARVATALAQQLDDQAALAATPAAGDPLRKQSKELVNTAIGWATKAVKQAPTDPNAMLAMADLLRLQGKSAKEVRKYLTAPADGAAVDFGYISALLSARDGKLADARKALAALDQGAAKLEQSGDVRIRFRQAMLAFADGKADEARQLLDTVLVAQAAHEGAKALSEKLSAAVATTDPLPPELNGSGSTATTPNPNPTNPTNPTNPNPNPNPTNPTGGEDYDHLVKRANDLAEVSCGKASELFNKALDQKPNGVEALVGLGFCSLDGKNYATAFSKFRAALAISPRNERALWGVAETYQQQSRKEQAIESYQRYLEVYPDSSAAKRQLERLGVTSDVPKDPPKDPVTPPTTPTTPTENTAPNGQPTKPTE